LDIVLDAGLTPSVKIDCERWKPLHWVLVVPDVMEQGGFDAIVGNPPFVTGSDITAAMGTNMRSWLVEMLAMGQRGNADLAAFFFLRAMALLTEQGTLGLIATNSIAQGASREVGLDRMVAAGLKIMRSNQSTPWPASGATLEYAAVWGTRDEVAAGVPRFSDGLKVRSISTLLEPVGRIDGNPFRLVENLGIGFEGCKHGGAGFILTTGEALALIEADARNEEVLFPFLGGVDLNSRPDGSASRWIIDFNDRSEAVACTYGAPYKRVRSRVLPVRMKNNRKVYRDNWWLYAEKRPKMRRAIVGMDELLALAVTSKTVMPLRVPTGQVFANTIDVFTIATFADQAVLSSSIHQLWAIKYGSGMRSDPRYTPSRIFETFPRPELDRRTGHIGETLDVERKELMLRRGLGLTDLYNLVNDSETFGSADPDVARMREIHVELDSAVMEAYGWGDVPLEHGFYTYRQMNRWTVSPVARMEILDRLLAENHRRAKNQGETPPPVDDDEDDE
jgi:hypothetical protein